MLVISSMKWLDKSLPEDLVNKLSKIITKHLNSKSLQYSVLLENGKIIFHPQEENCLVLSTVENKTILKEGDKRITQLKRNFLKSMKPTKEQYDWFFKVIHDALDALAIQASVMIINPDKSQSIIRTVDGERFQHPERKNYPVDINAKA